MNQTFKKGLKISGIIIGGLIILAIGASFFNFIKSSDYTANSSRQLSDLSYGAISKDAGGSESQSMGITAESDSIQPQPSAPQGADDRPLAELTDKKIIKNGWLTVYVRDAEQAAEAIRNLALSVGGFVSESKIYKSKSGFKSGSVIIRVPADNFEEIMKNVKGLAVEVEGENATSEDVTEQYVDFEAQLRNLRAEETQYLIIMERAYTINDTLQVANRLSSVRDRIERIQGKLQLLSRQIEMSTINITLEADVDVEVFGLRWRPLIVIKQSIRSMMENLSEYVDAMIRFLFQLPVIILWVCTVGLILFAVYKIGRFIFRKMFLRKKKDEEKIE